MPINPEPLFSAARFFECLEVERVAVKYRVAAISEDDMRQMDAEALTARAMVKFHIAPLELAQEHEFVYTPAMNGNQLTVEIPFEGDPHLWLAHPNFGSHLVVEGIIDAERKRLILTYQNPTKTGIEWCHREFQRRLALIRQNIQSLANMLQEHQPKMAHWVRRAIDLRKQQMATDGTL